MKITYHTKAEAKVLANAAGQSVLVWLNGGRPATPDPLELPTLNTIKPAVIDNSGPLELPEMNLGGKAEVGPGNSGEGPLDLPVMFA